MVFAVAWQPPKYEWAPGVVRGASAVICVAWLVHCFAARDDGFMRKLVASAWLVLGIALVNLVQHEHWTTAWPWFAPIGCATATLFGYLLASRQPRTSP
jgi:hypothetical protein